MKPRALDLFCGAGGATRGLQNAGFHVTGVDIRPQPRFCGDEFILADALEVPLEGYDFIWASPPCQAYSLGSLRWPAKHPDLIADVRARMPAVFWVMENVPLAPLHNPVMLCGSMFNLKLERHRFFESNFWMLTPSHPCFPPGAAMRREIVTVAGHGGHGSGRHIDWCRGMGIDWMTKYELTQAVPPAYAEFIGNQALLHMQHVHMESCELISG